MGGGHGGCALLTRPTLKVSVKMMVLLRLKKSASPFRRRPGRTGGTRCERSDNTGMYCHARPVAGGNKARLTRRGDFLPGAGIAKGAAASPLCTFA